MRTEDGYIIHRCLNGEREAFGLLVDKYKESIYAFAYSRLGNFHDAQDIAQETFIMAYKRLGALRRWDSFVAWLYAITSNLCKKWIQEHSKRPDREFLADQSQTVVCRASEDSYREDVALQPLRDALDSMPEMYHQVLTLFYLGGMSIKDIARFLGMSPRTIDRRLREARSRLRRDMLAEMETTFDEQRLQSGFTFVIVEAVKRMKIQPMPRTTCLPLGLSLAMGIIAIILNLSPHLGPFNPSSSSMGWPLPSEAKVLKTGEIFVDIMESTQIPALASKKSDEADMPTVRSVLSRSPEVVEDAEEAVDRLTEGSGYYVIGYYAETPEKLEFARGFCGLEASDSGFVSDGYGTAGFRTTGRSEPAGMYMAFRYAIYPDRHLRFAAPVGTEWTGESVQLGKWEWKSKVKTVIESDRETVMVPAGTFWGCLRLKTVIRYSEGPQEERDFVNGTRYMWFAPGAGLVKMEYYHDDNTTTNIELVSYSVSEVDKGYFPLDPGNRWTYKWTNGYRGHEVRETWAVVSSNPNTSRVCWYLLARGRRSFEEEVKEGWNLREEVKRGCDLSDEELDAAAQPLLEWRFAEWEDGRLKGFDVEAPQDLSDSHAQDEKGGGLK